MRAGNAIYQTIDDLPRVLPILAQPQLVLLPNGFVPVTIEDKELITMVNDVLRGDRLIGVVQPRLHDKVGHNETEIPFYRIGCMGRITNYSEIGDGSLLISLQGVCRFSLKEPLKVDLPYELFSIKAFDHDLKNTARHEKIDRDAFLSVFRDYLDMHNMQADWETILEAPDETLINALSIIAPFKSAEKQALLEADNLKIRSETLIALAERYIMLGRTGKNSHLLQ